MASLFLLLLLSTSSLLTLANAQACARPPPELANIASRYPRPGAIADIVSGDADANALYDQMLADPDMQAILKIAPKGTPAGNTAGLRYPANDPDCWWTQGGCMSPKHSGIADDIHTCQEPSTWGMTFDDGPYCGQKPLLDFLEREKVTGTFFLIGANVISQPVEAQDIFNRGHEVCGHTWSHHYMTALTNRQAFAEVYYTKKAIKEVVGVTSRCWRAAYGDVDDRIRAIGAFLDSRLVLWDNDTDDWQLDSGATRATIQNNFNAIIRQGSQPHGTIVLDHSISAPVIQMFISSYPSISGAFKHIMPALSCNNITQPYAETNVSYPDFRAYASGVRVNYTATTDANLHGGKLLLGDIANFEDGPPTTIVANATPSALEAVPKASAPVSGKTTTGVEGAAPERLVRSVGGAAVVAGVFGAALSILV